mmetsp:Transcript_36996/g.56703  ORF Transcript_36996/g.56703 Transcript_36996/m.56703 type:complete len:92 (+) Transcript_36996:1178-1453(+)
MTPIENDFPIKMQLPRASIDRLLSTNEFVFGTFPHQVKDTIESLISGLSSQDVQVFENQDLIITQHTHISSFLTKDEDGNDVTTAGSPHQQ